MPDKYNEPFPVEDLKLDHWNPDDPSLEKEDRDKARYYSRGEIAREMHVRAAQPVGPFARATLTTRLFPSLEDHFRRRLRYQIRDQDDRPGDAPDWPENLDKPQSVFDCIDLIAPIGTNLDDATEEGKQERLLDHLSGILRDSVKAYNPVEVVKAAEAEVSTLLRLIGGRRIHEKNGHSDRGGARSPVVAIDPVTRITLRADQCQEENPLEEIRKKAFPINFRQVKRLWMILANPSAGVEEGCNGETRMRLLWERFTLNQNFVVIEDVNQGACENREYSREQAADLVRTFLGELETGRSGFARNPDVTAIGRLQNYIDEAAKEGGSEETFHWFGRLLACAHYWISPALSFADYVDKDLSPDEIREIGLNGGQMRDRFEAIMSANGAEERERAIIADKTLCAAIAALGRRSFGRRGRISQEDREDFVLSSVVGGRAILLSELRPPDAQRADGRRSDDYVDPMGMGSRTLIIDLGMTAEQRGRLLSRLFDVATFRMLALRGYPAISTMNDTLNKLSTTLTQYYGDDGSRDSSNGDGGQWSASIRPAMKEADKLKDIRKQLDRRLKKVALLARSTAMLNPFVTYGITGKSLSASDYRDLVRARVEALREQRIPSYQTLGEIITRFHNAVDGIERVATRYDAIRRRLDEVTSLLRAQIDSISVRALQFEASEQSVIMDRLNVLTIAFIAVGFLPIMLASGSLPEPMESLGIDPSAVFWVSLTIFVSLALWAASLFVSSRSRQRKSASED